jgi:two-component system chemotaxis response regulator CheB
MARNAVIAIGASTGGIEAITTVLQGLPDSVPPVLIVQHLPQPFTRLFAGRLNSMCALKVKEAAQGDILHPGHVYIAPGNQHLKLGRGVSGWVTLLNDDPLLNGHRPSVDHLFDSVAQQAGRYAVGVILSGMGADGAAGLLRMKQVGAMTVGQDAASCVVYGMPRAAFEMGAVARQVALDGISHEIVACLQSLENLTTGRLRRV